VVYRGKPHMDAEWEAAHSEGAHRRSRGSSGAVYRGKPHHSSTPRRPGCAEWRVVERRTSKCGSRAEGSGEHILDGHGLPR